MTALTSQVAAQGAEFAKNRAAMEAYVAKVRAVEAAIEATELAYEPRARKRGKLLPRERLALLLLEALGVLGRFGAVLGADTLPVRKPDPVHLTETARRMGARPDLCVMLGDTRTDLDTARAARVPCVLTSFGFAAEPLHELAADAVVDHFSEIPAVLERLCPGPVETA